MRGIDLGRSARMAENNIYFIIIVAVAALLRVYFITARGGGNPIISTRCEET